jgi:hypothetical protein
MRNDTATNSRQLASTVLSKRKSEALEGAYGDSKLKDLVDELNTAIAKLEIKECMANLTDFDLPTKLPTYLAGSEHKQMSVSPHSPFSFLNTFIS